MIMRTAVLLILFGASCFGQTVSFNGCHQLFEDVNYVFSLDGTDPTGRNIYTTTPVAGDQHCGGIGTCEFRLSWNQANSRWEFLADRGNGDFLTPFVIYYNSAASAPNPPSLTLGTWIENNPTTNGECGGNLSGANASLTGSVQNTLLGIDGFSSATIRVYPNPAGNLLHVSSSETLRLISICNNLGQLIKQQPADETIDVSGLSPGLYFFKAEAENVSMITKFIKQ
ncbi:MAG: T9SS type A sorting domain-containing protein [Flavobacterium sp.]|nr:MAG: T9SS type A sorting domain-containing protein [Flavobacterium sp.]